MDARRLIGAALVLCGGAHVASAETLCAGKGTSDHVGLIRLSLSAFADTLFGESEGLPSG
jgi:hypothetical protein